MVQGMLEALGITEAEESVYRLILERPGSTLKDLIEESPFGTPELRKHVEILKERGLVAPSADRPPRLLPAPPEAALEILVLERQEQLEAVRVHAAELANLVRAGLQRARPGELVEVITGLPAVGERFAQIQRSAKQELLIFDKPPYAWSGGLNTPELELLARGIECRTVYDRSSLELPGRPDVIARYVEQGENARVFDGIPVKLAIVDRRVGLIPLNIAEPGREGAIQVHASALLDALAMFFEVIWERAVPIQAVDEGRETHETASEHARVLEMLALGLKDRTVARELGVSERTLDRRISEILDALGARTRFQAGLLAAQQGWLGPSGNERRGSAIGAHPSPSGEDSGTSARNP
jgi:sugar-specific transcriptional regulator TrmB